VVGRGTSTLVVGRRNGRKKESWQRKEKGALSFFQIRENRQPIRKKKGHRKKETGEKSKPG